MANTILLLDDRGETSAAHILLEAGYHVIRTSSEPEAVRAIREQSLDLIITDMIIEERFGSEVIREIRSSAPSLPVIVISSWQIAHQLAQFDLADRLGAAAMLYRPFSENSLLDIVEQLTKTPPKH